MNIRWPYIPLTVAWLVLLTSLIPLLAKIDFPFEWFVSCLVALLIAVPITRFEWLRNRRAIVSFMLVMLTIPLVTSAAVVVFFRDEPVLAAAGVFVASLAVIAYLASALWRDFHFADRLPNRLSERFLDDDNFEDDGVQWVVQCDGHDAATPLNAIVCLQNNIDAERVVRIRFRVETPFAGGAKALRFAPVESVHLPPGADATVTIPFVASETRPRKKIHAYVYVSATGPHGERNRRQRANAGPRPTSRWLAIFGLVAGYLMFNRGGIRIIVRSSGAASTDVELSPMHVELNEVQEQKELFGGALGPMS